MVVRGSGTVTGTVETIFLEDKMHYQIIKAAK